jgi:hypothetical protein
MAVFHNHRCVRPQVGAATGNIKAAPEETSEYLGTTALEGLNSVETRVPSCTLIVAHLACCLSPVAYCPAGALAIRFAVGDVRDSRFAALAP